jgi:hypothetical protein
MNRRDLLKRAAIVPVAALGTLLVSSTPAEAAFAHGTLKDIFPGGFGPESLNGGDIVVKVLDSDTLIFRTALVDKKTSIRIGGSKIKYRALLEEVYTNQQVLLHNLYNNQVSVTYRTGLKAKTIDIFAED